MREALTYPQWLDYLEHFLEVEPEANSEDLFKRFPELQKDEKVLDAAYAHILAVKIDEISPAQLRVKFPEIYRPRKIAWWQRLIIWMKKS